MDKRKEGRKEGGVSEKRKIETEEVMKAGGEEDRKRKKKGRRKRGN